MHLLALWLLLRFTAPGDTVLGHVVPCKSYTVTAKDPYGYIWSPTPYDTQKKGRPQPHNPGTPDSIYVSLSEDQRYRLFKVAAKDSAGNRARWSNTISAQAFGKQVWWRGQPSSVWP